MNALRIKVYDRPCVPLNWMQVHIAVIPPVNLSSILGDTLVLYSALEFWHGYLSRPVWSGSR